MKLIQEADVDDTFNKRMGKIQEAIEALEKLATKMDYPVSSQIRMIELAAQDLAKLGVALKSKRS